MGHHNRSALLATIQILQTRGLGDRTFQKILAANSRLGMTLTDSVDMSPEDRTSYYGLSQEIATGVDQTFEAAERITDKLLDARISVLLRTDSDYPQSLIRRLGKDAPAFLFVRGNLDLMNCPSVGFCGSRKASKKGLQVASDSAVQLAKEGINIISGYAHGVDLATHSGALRAGGVTTMVLAEGILQFQVKREVADLCDENNTLVISEFPPQLPWIARNAMRRNHTICGLSDALIVIESGLQGGTFEAGNTALRLNLPLFVAHYANPAPSAEGNDYFLKRGATAIGGSREGRPNLAKVLHIVKPEAIAQSKPPQPALEQSADQTKSEPLSVVQIIPPVTISEPEPVQPSTVRHPKRLIEVDLPIKRISAHARREKSIRHGHISTLHIWWARRPLAACRAVICAALWPDPADPACPDVFRRQVAELLHAFARKAATSERLRRGLNLWWNEVNRTASLPSETPAQQLTLRKLLLDFIADFANWDNAAVPEFLETARALTAAAHEALGGEAGTRPLVVDPFAGGGAIPLEALRVGADAFASDLNPIPVLLNKVTLEYIPKYGQKLADAVCEWGAWIKEQAEQELGVYYPKDPDGSTPIAYLWARTITCEGPGCGAEVPLIRSFWLSKKDKRAVALKLVPNPAAMRVDFEIMQGMKAKEVGEGTVRRGSATCPVCGFTTPVTSVRRQLKARHGGAADARLFCVVTTYPDKTGRFYRLPTEQDRQAIRAAIEELERRKAAHTGDLSLVPDEPTPKGGGSGAGRAFSQRNYGMDVFADLFTPRQLLALTTLARLVRDVGTKLSQSEYSEMSDAIQSCLSLAISRLADRSSSLCTWRPQADQEKVEHVFARQALPMTWDFAEGSFLSEGTAGWLEALEPPLRFIELSATVAFLPGQVNQNNATYLTLPNDSVVCLVTDPPYYDAVPYSDLSDYFYVWLRRTSPHLFNTPLTPKDDECIVDEVKGKDRAYFERMMTQAMAEGRRILAPEGIGVVVFAHKSTAGWEAMLQSMIEAGWIITGSWPIDTEMGTRLRARDSAALASSIHLVCRPRESASNIQTESVGDWRDVLAELPQRIHEWMPRLAHEGVVGADAIFACIGPALEIFSRYARVEKSSGEQVTLREYLEQVWAAVAREALNMIFKGADASGLEEDARLTAMWLWTIYTGGSADSESDDGEDDESILDDDSEGAGGSAKAALSGGYVLEYDAARKIAQGFGADLEKLTTLVEVRGDKARLRPVSERAEYLFGKDSGQLPTTRRKRGPQQLSLFAVMTENVPEGETSPEVWDDIKIEKGRTLLDQIHQSLILFGTGRGEALRRFLVDDGVGKEGRFWRLAQSLSALYPTTSDEKRWIDGVLGRKKGLGL